MTDFAELARTLDDISRVSGRNAKIDLVASFLRQVRPKDLVAATRFLGGAVFSERDPKVLNVSWRGVKQALKQVVDFNDAEFSQLYEGDTGEAVAALLETEGRVRQAGLFSSSLTVSSVEKCFKDIAEAEGSGSRKKKESLLSQMLREASTREARYIVALVLNDMRIGLSKGLLAEGLAKAFEIGSDLVRRAWSLSGDLGQVAHLAATEGRTALEILRPTVFSPVRPMLATPADSVAELLQDSEYEYSFELKFDGARAQVHKDGRQIRIYSRRMQDVTGGLPDIVAIAERKVRAKEAILDCEVVAVDAEGRPFPFQTVMRRFGRTRNVETAEKEVTLRLYIFDVLLADGESLIDSPYSERRKTLHDVADSDLIAENVVTSDIAAASGFFERSRELGHEGLMAKRVDSPYVPGVRGKNWFKVKHTLDTMDLVVVAAEWGHGRRSKWLSDYHLAVRNEDTGGFATIGKTFKGLTDAEFEEMTLRLQAIKTGEKGHIVTVRPEIVVEVLASEIQSSPTYDSGMALRFARILNTRYDKGPEDATTLDELRRIYEKQFKFKAR
ncbi:MAG: ATP-dependent DNA ligase [Candidatus Thorarchaeota archaeon]